MGEKEHYIELMVADGTPPTRIDTWVSQQVPTFPRSAASDQRTQFFINGKKVKKSKTIQAKDAVSIIWTEDVMGPLVGEDLPLDILYEDDHILVINKQQGLVVHPGFNNWDGTLVHALIYRYGTSFFSGENESEGEEDTEIALRPGIVHRLDKETSGVMVVAKDSESQLNLSAQFKARTTEKYYIALVWGQLPATQGVIETTLIRDRRNRKRFCVGKDDEGRLSVTEYEVLRQYYDVSLVRIRLITGRTHQIRVHMLHLGCPIVGDPIYGRRKKSTDGATLMLHAFSLALSHPVSAKRMVFRAPLAQRFKTYLGKMRD
ncbi:MAG: RluA family pseudouridine synthase [Sphaerochaetaceae bacterium]|nr:RluA family pseudouridine synthase [Sphaerochaetaceae bacterium]